MKPRLFVPRLLLVSLLGFLSLVGTLQAQPAVDLQQIDAYIAEAQQAWPVPGLAVAIVQDGEVVFEKGYGVRRVGTDAPVDEHTVFAIASNTKAFIAASLALLVDEGRISWDDRVRDHLPYFALYDPYVTEEMRIRDLLSHRSGLGTFSGDLLWYGTDYTPEEVVRRARHLEPAGPFRSSYGYSNLMFITAGEVIRAVTGQSWAEFAEARILDPLGMERTVTSVTALEAMDNVATPHKPTPDDLIPLEWFNWDTMGAAGGLISSVDDMARWLRLQLAGGSLGEVALFSEDAQHEMWSAHTVIPVSRASLERYPSIHFRAYGLGWALNDYLGRKIVSHGGGYDGMFSRVVLVPEENLGFVVLTNSMTGIATALSNYLLDAFLGGEPRDWSAEMLAQDLSGRTRFFARIDSATVVRAEGTSPSLPLAAYTGTYGGPMYGDAEVTLEDGGLVLHLLPAETLVADLTHLHHNVFRLDWREEYAWFGSGNAHFILNARGEVERIKLDVPNDDLWFYELELNRKAATP